MLWKRFRIFYISYKVWIWITFICVILVALSIVGLSYMDSYFAQQQVATFPLEALKMVIWSVVSAFFFVKMVYGGGMFTGTRNTQVDGKSLKVTFKDVIGLTNAKKEAMEVVSLIKDRAKIKKIGGKVIHGLLMMGPPGCGKTYLAKAIACEAGVPFLSMSGSDFVEVFVGVGASRVRKTFEIAQNLAYIHGGAIIFIDEIDAIGRARKFSAFGSQESDTTLNQLLVAMDGLSQDKGGGNVIVIGATNAAEGTLDPALIRPGRFDRTLQVTHPRLTDREELFRYYLSKIKTDPSIDIGRLARRSVWKTPADIENIVKESALISLREDREVIQYKDLSKAIERVDLGLETHLELGVAERERVAFHETGHLVALYYEHPTDDVFKASINTRGGALGVVYHNPREELHMETQEQLFANIKVSLAGYMSEKIRYKNTTTGACNDFGKATRNASNMVWMFGMAPGGLIGDYSQLEGRMSENFKDRLSQETQNILAQAAKEVEDLLRKEWDIVQIFVQELVKRGELDYDEIETIFKEHGKERRHI
jgi:cell division protease FtsH